MGDFEEGDEVYFFCTKKRSPEICCNYSPVLITDLFFTKGKVVKLMEDQIVVQHHENDLCVLTNSEGNAWKSKGDALLTLDVVRYSFD